MEEVRFESFKLKKKKEEGNTALDWKLLTEKEKKH